MCTCPFGPEADASVQAQGWVHVRDSSTDCTMGCKGGLPHTGNNGSMAYTGPSDSGSDRLCVCLPVCVPVAALTSLDWTQEDESEES